MENTIHHEATYYLFGINIRETQDDIHNPVVFRTIISIMESLLASETQTKKNGDLRESLCYYLSIIIVLLTFIFSCVSLGICSASTIQAKLYTYKFPFFDRFVSFTPGTPVHIDRHGNAFPGAGTTIYLNITNELRGKPMYNVKLRELNHYLTLAVYNGGISAFRGSWDASAHVVRSEELPLTKDHDPRRVSDVIKLRDNRFIIIGSKEILPLTVNHDYNPNTKTVSVDFVFGEIEKLMEDDDRWPHVDRLSNNTFAMTYENGYDVYSRIGFWDGEGSSAKIKLSDAQRLYTRFSFHGVAGLDEKHFIVAVTGSYNQTGGTWPIVAANLATIEDDKVTIDSAKWKVLPFELSHNFFDIDNFDDRNAVMVFANSATAGIDAVLIHYDNETNEVYFGAHRRIQNGGAVLDYNRIDIRVLSYNSFAVFYEDNAIHRLVLVLCSLTNSKDIAVVSPKYIISTGRRGWRGEVRTWYDICEQGWGNFNMIEYSEVKDGERTRNYVFVHKGVVQARLFGIAQKSHKNHVEIQFAGMFNVPKKYTFTPGRAIYTNSKGELVQGAPYGYANRDFGHFYEYSSNYQEIFAGSNVVGMAVTKKKVYMKFH